MKSSLNLFLMVLGNWPHHAVANRPKPMPDIAVPAIDQETSYPSSTRRHLHKPIEVPFMGVVGAWDDFSRAQPRRFNHQTVRLARLDLILRRRRL
ncbi:MAG: hypothetical protein ACXWKX_14000 [Caulobacteraceae bacterium]